MPPPDILRIMREFFGLEPVDGNDNATSNKVIKGLSSLLGSNQADVSFGGSGDNVETVIASYSIPAGSRYAGGVLDYNFHIDVPTTVGTDTLRLRMRIGGLTGDVIFDSTALDVANGDSFSVVGQVIWRAISSTVGTAMNNLFSINKIGGTDVPSAAALALSSLDTKSAQTVVLTAEWSTENANNMILRNYSVKQS